MIMETTTRIIARVNNVDIMATSEEQLIPIRPLCEALGIDPEGQRQRIERDEILSPVACMIKATGADGKQYEMYCIPCKYVFGWLFSIDASRVSDEARPAVQQYKLECYDALYRHFFGSQRRQLEQNQVEIALLEQLADYTQQREAANNGIRDTRRKLEKLRQERLADEPQLFG